MTTNNSLFGSFVIYINKDTDLGDHSSSSLAKLLRLHGATVPMVLSKRVTHVIGDPKKGPNGSLVVLSCAYFLDCIKQNKIIDKNINNDSGEDSNKDSSAETSDNEKIVDKDVVESNEGDEESEDVPIVVPEKIVTKKVMISKGKVPVDPDCKELVATGEVYDDGSVWCCVLNQTNIGHNNNKFYNMQVITSKNKYYLFSKWGRVGASGQQSLEECSNANMACRKFEKKFSEKTKNQWAKRSSFTPVSGKYVLIDIDYNNEEDTVKKTIKTKTGTDSDQVVQSKLDDRVKCLVKNICNVENIKATMVEMKFDINKMPLGKLKKTTLEKASSILSEIEKVLVSAKDNDAVDSPDSGPEEADYPSGHLGAEAPQARLLELSNQFYSYIPHYYGMGKLPIINTLKMVKSKADMIEELGYIEIATKLMNTSVDSNLDPIDKEYNSLNTDIEPLDPKSDEYALIEKYATTTHSKHHTGFGLKLKNVYTISRKGANGCSKRFEKHLDDKNRKLLWHGSRMTNFCGILSQGLRIAPPEAPCTGYMFGKGVYFADMVSKSAQYCYTSRSNTSGYLLLCDVALGDSVKFTNAQSNLTRAPPGYQSTMGLGNTVPTGGEPLSTDKRCKVPMGPCTTTNKNGYGGLLHNEYIVYDTAQINIRYLVEFDFQY